MEIRWLRTANAVIDCIGAPELARATGREPQNIWNWRKANRLAHQTYLICQDLLAKRGAAAPSKLWDIDPLPSRAQASRPRSQSQPVSRTKKARKCACG
jgi:hypothetical protein